MAYKKKKPGQSVFLKKGKGISRIPMSGLKSLESAGKKFQKVTGKKNMDLKEVQKEIMRRKRK